MWLALAVVAAGIAGTADAATPERRTEPRIVRVIRGELARLGSVNGRPRCLPGPSGDEVRFACTQLPNPLSIDHYYIVAVEVTPATGPAPADWPRTSPSKDDFDGVKRTYRRRTADGCCDVEVVHADRLLASQPRKLPFANDLLARIIAAYERGR